MNPVFLSLLGICATLLGTLATVLWKGSAVITRLEKDLEHQTKLFSEKFDRMGATADRLEDRLQSLDSVPDMIRRISQVEGVQSNALNRIEALWLKVMSSDKHIAVIESRAVTASGPAVQPQQARPPSYPDLGEHRLPPLPPPPQRKK